MTKNEFQYKPERDRKIEFARLLLEWVTLGRLAEYEVEALRRIMVAHVAARQPQPQGGSGNTQAAASQNNKWIYPGFDPQILANPPNPASFKLEVGVWDMVQGRGDQPRDRSGKCLAEMGH